MKRSFTLMLAAFLMLMTSFVWGQTRDEVVAYTLDGTITGGTNSYATESEITQNNLTWMVMGNTTQNPWRIGGKSLTNENRPVYSTGTMSDNITKIVVTHGTASGITVNSMTLIVSSNSDFSNPTSTLTGDFDASSTTTFNRPTGIDWSNKYYKIIYNVTVSSSSNKYLQFESAEFYKENSGQQTVATPTFSPAAGTYYEAQNVTISCTTTGATIYYTTDGTTPTTSSSVYSSPIAISTTTTVKAMGVKSGMDNSSVATATYTFPTISTIAEARAMAVNAYAMVQGVVTFIDGRNVYVQDETAGIDLYLNTGTVPSGLALGDMVLAYGKRANFNGLLELSNINGGDATQFQIISTGNTLPLAEKTIAEILADHNGDKMLQSTRVQIVDATIGTINTSNNTPITQGESTMNIYKIPALEGIEAGDAIDVIGIIGCYNNPQLRVAYAADVVLHQTPMEQVATPTFNPVEGTYTEAQDVEIACTTEGATIYYTLDGTTPTTSSNVYSAAITISENTTVKAYAVKENMLDSDVATAEYTINIVPPTPTLTFNRLASHFDVTNDGIYMIVDVNGGFALTSANGTGSAPTAVAVTIENDAITGNIADELQWNFTAVDGGYTINPISNAETFLYTTSTNNGVRIGTNANNVWELDITDDANYHGFKNVASSRYIGVYNNQDWRTYTSVHNNIKNTTIEIFVLGNAPTPTYYTVSVAEGIANGTVTVDPTSAVEGATITVTATPDDNYELTALTYTYEGLEEPISIVETQEFEMPAADVTVNATFALVSSVAAPAFSLEEGSYITAQELTISCDTEEATIYYTVDGTEPTTENSLVYTEPITISETTTVKAFAVKTGMLDSDVTSATFTIIEPVTIASARALELNEYALVQGVVTFIDGRNVYVQDDTAGIVLYLNSNTVPDTLAMGDMVMAYGKRAAYKGLVELSGINGGNENQFVIVSNGNELPVAVKTIAEVLADFEADNMLQSTRVQIVDATIGAINTSGNTPIYQDENTVNLYKMPEVEGLLENDIVTVIGVVGCYNTPQIRIASADDVTYTHPVYPLVTGAPTELTGLNYIEGEGPSEPQAFVLNGANLTTYITIHAAEDYEVSYAGGDNFTPMTTMTLTPSVSGVINNVTVYTRLKAGLEIGTYDETMYINSSEIDTVFISVSGSVTEAPVPSDYTRITDLSQLGNGAKVVFAARYNDNTSEYYAMTAEASGKPTGVLFTSAGENLPTSISDEEETYYWTVDTDGSSYTFTNAAGDVLGYTSGTNFATGGDNTAWTIEYSVSDSAAMVPLYNAFVITNANNTGRAIALNTSYNFGAYSKSNMTGSNAANYNFLIDMFATEGSGTLTCATPTFTPEAGTYFEAQSVAISCNTADAEIYYTLDGSDPTENSSVYSEPITVDENLTIKAIAMKEGYENSNIAEAEYTIIIGAVTIFNQDWEGDMNGWTFVTVEGEKPWTIGQYQGNHYAYGNGYNGGVNEQWCISPAFDLDSYSDVTLSFVNAKNYSGPDMQLYFSNDYDGADPTAATWIELSFEMSTGSFAWVESGTIELADYTGTNCYIGFKYTSTETEAAAWEVDDVTLMGFTTDPYLTVTPASLSGFTHIVGEGPSASQTFVLTAGNISPAPGGTTGSINVSVFSPFEISLDDEDYGDEIFFEDITNLEPTTIYVRMNGTEVGQYTETVNIYASSGDEATVTLSGNVTEQPVPGGDWNRIYALSDLHDGDQVIIASRYDATVGDGYYAMTAGVSGKPDGVLFTSVNEGGVEKLPAEISDDADTYMWNVTLDGDVITLTNAAGDTLGYSSSTNFSGNTSTDWNIALQTSEEGALIPNYTGFVITNAETTNRGVAKNSSNKFGAYSTSNISNTDYNFFMDLFVYGGSVTPTVATPVFSVASGTYYAAFEVEITCATEGATIYYTTDGSDPTAESEVYEEPIYVDSDITIKAIAMMEGYENSGIATSSYIVMSDLVVLVNQDWEGEMDGWTFVTIEGNKPWVIGQYNNNHYANANGYSDDVDNEQWCISPAFNLNGRAYRNVTLTFMNATKFDGPALELYFSNDYDGQDPTAASWESLEYIPSEGNYTWTESGEISLDGFSGSNCYIAFRYISTIDEGAAAWEVDDIMITAEVVTSTITPDAALNVNVWNNSNELMIENGSDETLNMIVYNIVGQPVLSKTVTTGSNVIRHSLAEGVYIVRFVNGRESTSVKVVVRR